MKIGQGFGIAFRIARVIFAICPTRWRFGVIGITSGCGWLCVARKPVVFRMIADFCPCCYGLHDPPACSHDPEAPCPGCGNPKGGKTSRMSGESCWRCTRKAGLET